MLLSSDGTINIEGDLISAADGYYLIQTALGDLRVGFDRVVCQGAACPVTEEIEVDATIGGSDLLAEGLDAAAYRWLCNRKGCGKHHRE